MSTMVQSPMQGLDKRNPSRPGMTSFVITPDDANELQFGALRIWVGGPGAVKVSLVSDPPGHTGTLISGVPAGTLLNIAVRQVYATGTTATLLVGFG